MRFGKVPPGDAHGAVLAHSLLLPDGLLRKGAVLDAAALQRIANTGIGAVTVAELDPGNVDQNTAATMIA